MKKLSILLAIAVVLSLFAGCSKPKELDLSDLSEQLNENVIFSETLMLLGTEDAERLYRIEESDVSEVIAYAGTGATVDEFSLWKAVDTEAVLRIAEKVQERIDAQREGYLDYKADEVPKLDNAVLVQSGNYVFLCITEDAETAQKIIDDFIR